MSVPPVRSYEEFWPHYVRAHSKRATRLVHAVGTSAAIASLAAFALTRRPGFLLAAPVAGYGLAWYSHFFIENNRPATFGNPLWSLRGDFEMLARMVLGSMDAEVERHCAEPAEASPEAPEAPAVATDEAPAVTDPSLN